MKKYNKPEVMLFDCANESIALTVDARYLSVGNDDGSYVTPEAEDIW